MDAERLPRWRALLRAAGSGWPAAIAGLPLATGAVVFAWRGVGAATVLQMGSVRAWGIAFAGLLVAGIVDASLERGWARAAASAGLLSILAHPVVSAALRVDASLAVGEGSTELAWLRKEAGFAAVAPEVEVLRALEPGEALRLRVDGEELSVAEVGGAARTGGTTVRAAAVHAAPAFEIRNANGTLLEGGFVEVGGPAGGYIEVPTLPHRFYFSGSDAERGAAAGSRGDAMAPLSLRILRGKLRVFDGRIAAGQAAAFDGLTLRWRAGSRWLEVTMTRRPRGILLVAGALLLAEAAIFAFVARRGRR